MKLFTATVVAISMLAFARETHASVILSVTYEKSFPFGPFTPTETIEVVATATNTSADRSIFICEGVCIGDPFTYSLGASASIPNGYSFHFGDGGDTASGFLNGQIAGELLPGQEKDFLLGEYLPISQAQLGTYGFHVQLQIFSATAERPMIDSSSFGGTWQVVDDPTPVPEPTTFALALGGLCAAGLLGTRNRSRVASLPTVF
jgi:hypothetical protein